ncbi:MAG: dihydrodipicolinate synthase family protein [Dehalococcoidia bacterium]
MRDLDLRGLIPATLLPLTDDHAVDETGLRAYIRWLLGFEGLKALAVNMDTGEGPHLSRDEKRRVLDIYVEEVRGRLPLLAGIGARYTAEAVDLARDAEAAGAGGIVVFPIPAFAGEPLPPDVPVAYHRAIAEAVPLPIVLFQLQPALAGVLFSRETLLRLIEIPNVIAIKEASFDAVRFVETRRILEEAPRRIQLLTGNDNFIFESFVLAAEGALIGFGTVAIAEQVEMVRLLRGRDTAAAQRIDDAVVRPLASALFAPPVRNYRARLKEALRLLGVIPRATMRPPLLDLDAAERDAVRRALEAVRLAAPARTYR